MNNNQFKKIIRESIELTAMNNDLMAVYVDTKSLTRVYYFYNRKGKCKGTLEVTCYNEYARLYFKKGDEELASFIHNDAVIERKYFGLKDIIEWIDTLLDSIKCKCGGNCKCKSKQ